MSPNAERRKAKALERVRSQAGGVTLSGHARERAEELGFHETAVLGCVARPEIIYPCHPAHGPDRVMFQRGPVACVVEGRGVVVTVLINTTAAWEHGRHNRSNMPCQAV